MSTLLVTLDNEKLEELGVCREVLWRIWHSFGDSGNDDFEIEIHKLGCRDKEAVRFDIFRESFNVDESPILKFEKGEKEYWYEENAELVEFLMEKGGLKAGDSFKAILYYVDQEKGTFV